MVGVERGREALEGGALLISSSRVLLPFPPSPPGCCRRPLSSCDSDPALELGQPHYRAHVATQARDVKCIAVSSTGVIIHGPTPKSLMQGEYRSACPERLLQPRPRPHFTLPVMPYPAAPDELGAGYACLHPPHPPIPLFAGGLMFDLTLQFGRHLTVVLQCALAHQARFRASPHARPSRSHQAPLGHLGSPLRQDGVYAVPRRVQLRVITERGVYEMVGRVTPVRYKSLPTLNSKRG